MRSVLVLALMAACCAADAAERSIPLFSSGQIAGSPPSACDSALTGNAGGPPRWQFVQQGDRSGLAEVSREKLDARYPLCIVKDVRATDLEIAVDLIPQEGEIDRAGGLAFRLQDRNNYFVVRANALENNVRLYRTVNGNRIQFAGADTPVASGKPQRLAVKIAGDLITVSFAGKQLFEVRDTTFRTSGGIALWSKADSFTLFANLTVDVSRE